jgi:hypothetical protein
MKFQIIKWPDKEMREKKKQKKGGIGGVARTGGRMMCDVSFLSSWKRRRKESKWGNIAYRKFSQLASQPHICPDT